MSTVEKRGEKALIEEANRRFHQAKVASQSQREDYKTAMRMTYGEQWDEGLKSSRQKAGRPALSFPVLHTYVQRVTNQARKERPQPKVNAVGNGASQDVAEVYEGLFRHVFAASAADVAFDTAVECAGAGGFGYYEFVTEYIDDETFDQEPRIRRILDPLTIYFDPNCLEPDYSDANYYFKRKRLHKDDFKREFGKEAETDWGDGETQEDWCDGDYVYIAEYCYVEKTQRKIEQLDELGKVVNSRVIIDRQISKCIIDGSRVLEETKWLGKWLPMVPVLGKEVVVDDKRKLMGIVAFSLDSQKLINATGSGVAEQLQLASRAPWVGAKGSMKDKRWDDNTQNYSKLEYEAYDEQDRPNPPPQRNTYEAPIQALTSALLLFTDNLKKSIGYVDTVHNASQADLSGIAVARREQQADLTNSHIEDNLVRSQWHAGRILLDLLQKYIDTPRAIRILAPDGGVSMAAITMAMDGGIVPVVAGFEGKPHTRIDVGKYDVTIASGPSYSSKLESEVDVLLKAFAADPNLWGICGDLLFKAMGYEDLEARLRMALPPQIQQAIENQDQQISPAAQAKLMQMAQQNQILLQQMEELKAGIQKLMFERQAKIVENQSKAQISAEDNASRERIAAMKAGTDVQTTQMKHSHDDATAQFQADNEFIHKLTDLIAAKSAQNSATLMESAKLQMSGNLEREKLQVSREAARRKPPGRAN
jgi:hypothetical protein